MTGPPRPATNGGFPRRRRPASELVEELTAVRRESDELLRDLLAAQELLDTTERAALETFEEAAGRPQDERCADRAVAAARACDDARAIEHEAAERWFGHRQRFRVLVEETVASLGGLAMVVHRRS
jgi:hypothetical protein